MRKMKRPINELSSFLRISTIEIIIQTNLAPNTIIVSKTDAVLLKVYIKMIVLEEEITTLVNKFKKSLMVKIRSNLAGMRERTSSLTR